ncbi:MAG: LPS assembly lipoprotein LptE [Burkholderiaceae bacterium]|jgi:LPS-assembly lipoprotein
MNKILRNKTAAWALYWGLCSALLLPGCGFKLRGQSQLPFQSVLLEANNSSTLTQELRRVLRANKITLATDVRRADALLAVTNEVRLRNVLSFTSTGRAREVQLRYIVTVQLKDRAGLFLMAPSDIALQRDITYSDDQILAKESEELLLYKDMQSDVVQQLMRRLEATKVQPGTVPAPSAPAVER